MKNSIMEALFDGGVIPWERRNSHSAERKALELKIEKERQYFMGKMSLDDCQRFQAFQSILDQAAFDEEVDIYSHGFTLGALLMIEVMEKKDTMLEG